MHSTSICTEQYSLTTLNVNKSRMLPTFTHTYTHMHMHMHAHTHTHTHTHMHAHTYTHIRTHVHTHTHTHMHAHTHMHICTHAHMHMHTHTHTHTHTQTPTHPPWAAPSMIPGKSKSCILAPLYCSGNKEMSLTEQGSNQSPRCIEAYRSMHPSSATSLTATKQNQPISRGLLLSMPIIYMFLYTSRYMYL